MMVYDDDICSGFQSTLLCIQALDNPITQEATAVFIRRLILQLIEAPSLSIAPIWCFWR